MFDAQAKRWPLWAPVLFGAGCAVWLGLRADPPTWALWAALAGLVTLAVLARRTGHAGLVAAATLAACLAAGLAFTDLRAQQVRAPVAPPDLGVVTVEGWVVDVASPGKRGARILIAPTWIEGLKPAETPIRVRVTLNAEATTPAPGSAVRLRAILNPPPPPASPGSYDFARDSWFQSIGGVGFSFDDPERIDAPAPPPPRLQWRMRINAARWALAERIVARLGERIGGVAAAMTTGHEAWIPNEDVEAMRDSGLAHILSISGLHMAIVGGFVFFAVRLGVAAWPWLALRAPGKKIAAVAGLLAVGVYLVVSGGPPAAERAAITASVAFLAILIDRRAVSFNALAVAAFVVLMTRPESVANPGFQMSFAATAALVALAELWPQRIAEINTPWPIAAVQRAGSWFAAGAAVSLVAGLATAPFAIQHFNRTSNYSLIANLLESPISTLVTMPMLAIGATLEPLGLGAPFLAGAGWGVEATLGIAHFFAEAPGANHTISSAPQVALPISFFGILFACLWRGRLRWLGVPLALAVLVWPRPATPDVWVAADGSNLAVREGKTAIALRPTVKTFAAELWTRRRGLEPAADPEAATEARYACQRFACVPLGGRSPKVSAWFGKKPPPVERLAGLCRAADLIVVRATVAALPTDCRGKLLLDGLDFRTGGALELWRKDGRWLGKWSAGLRGRRPWTVQ